MPIFKDEDDELLDDLNEETTGSENTDTDNNDDTDTNTTEEVVIPVVSAKETQMYTNKDLGTSTLFNKDKQLDAITSNIDGMPWTIQYFNQLKGLNETPKMPDVNVPASALKYNRVSDMEILLQSAIDQTDPNNIEGEAVINTGIVPNYGDPFIATLTGGREAIFVITGVSKKNYNLHNAFAVTFKLHVFLDKNSEFYRDIVYKIVNNYVYDKNHLKEFSAPILLEEDFVKKINLREQPNIILEHYCDYMLNKDVNTFALPTNTSVYLDSLVLKFLFKIINRLDNPALSDVNEFNLDNLEVKHSLWDVLLRRDIVSLKKVDRDLGFMLTPGTVSDPSIRNIGYMGIRFIVDKLGETSKLSIDVKPNMITGTFDKPISETSEKEYVFTKAFYEQDTENAGYFENLVLQYLRGERLDDTNLTKAISEYVYWETEEQFYLLPILMLLIKSNLEEAYTQL